MLHPRRRRLDGLDPQLVPRRGDHLQGWIGRRRQPVEHPRLGGAAPGRRDGLGPGVVHAWRRRLGGHDQVGRQDPSRRQDGHPQRRPPRHRGLHLVQGPRGAQGRVPCATPGSTWTSTGPTRSRSSTRTPTTRCGSPTSSCRPCSTTPTGHSPPAPTARPCPHRQGPRPVPPDRPRRLGVRRPGHAVRHDHQPLAHGAQRRPDQRQQPLLFRGGDRGCHHRGSDDGSPILSLWTDSGEGLPNGHRFRLRGRSGRGSAGIGQGLGVRVYAPSSSTSSRRTGRLRCTPEHRFLTAAGEFVQASVARFRGLDLHERRRDGARRDRRPYSS